MATINAYLHFSGNCREAMTYYKQCFGGELTLQTVEGSPVESQCPVALRHHILHASLIREELVLLASDIGGRKGIEKNASCISLTMNCRTEEEIDAFFYSLAKNGKVIEPLEDRFWGAKWGVVIDQYGINWMLNYDKNSVNN